MLNKFASATAIVAFCSLVFGFGFLVWTASERLRPEIQFESAVVATEFGLPGRPVPPYSNILPFNSVFEYLAGGVLVKFNNYAKSEQRAVCANLAGRQRDIEFDSGCQSVQHRRHRRRPVRQHNGNKPIVFRRHDSTRRLRAYCARFNARPGRSRTLHLGHDAAWFCWSRLDGHRRTKKSAAV